MKKSITSIALFSALLLGEAVHAQGPMTPPLVSPTSTTVPSSAPDKVTFVAVAVPIDIDVTVKVTQQTFVALLKLNNPDVDAVLKANNVRIIDGGKIIFDPVTGRQ